MWTGFRGDQSSLNFCPVWPGAWTGCCWEEAGDDEGKEAKSRKTEEEANPSSVIKKSATECPDQQVIDDIAGEQKSIDSPSIFVPKCLKCTVEENTLLIIPTCVVTAGWVE